MNYKFSFEKYVKDLYGDVISDNLKIIIDSLELKKLNGTSVKEVPITQLKKPSYKKMSPKRIYTNYHLKVVYYIVHNSKKIFLKDTWLEVIP